MSSKALLDHAVRTDFHWFLLKVFDTVNPDVLFQDGWHLKAVCHSLALIENGTCRRLIINQPPRSLKSITVSVAFPAWLLTRRPGLQILVASYSQDFAEDLHRLFRQVVNSPWYRRLFPNVRVDRDTTSEFHTAAGGRRLAVSVGGSLTGRGADIIIIDDPSKADEINSEAERTKVNRWVPEVLLSRLNDKGKGAIILVQQRLHEEDLSGFLLEQGGWEHLCLPAIAEKDEAVAIGEGEVIHRKQGEPLSPERESLEVLQELQRQMGSFVFSAQYQQRPVPFEGNLFRRAWVKFVERVPQRAEGDQIIQSWDVAGTTRETSDYSACTTWLVRKKEYYLIDVDRQRLAYPELRARIVAVARKHRAGVVLIENIGLGNALISDFRASSPNGMPRPIGVRPAASKEDRAVAHFSKFEAGQVSLPADAPWLAPFLHEMLGFPNGRHDDQVDSVTQFLAWMSRRRPTSFHGGIAFPLYEPDFRSYRG